MFTVQYHQQVVKRDIPVLSSTNKKKIKAAIESKLQINPDLFGKPLRRSLKGYKKLRVGDYRIIFKIVDKVVQILAIQHRSVVYKNTTTHHSRV